MTETPRANRIHIAFFGLRNAGKSTLVNAFTGQQLAIVSDTPGTTTDPVSKAMEILPLGPCLVTDTAGLDDVGELGAQRVAKTLDVLATTDIAVWVHGRGRSPSAPPYQTIVDACRAKKITLIEFFRGDSVEALKEKIAALKIADDTPGLLDGLAQAGDRVICVCPIDGSAPKGRLILPQVQVIRAALDLHATCEVCQPEEFAAVLEIANYRLQIAESRSQIAESQSQVAERRFQIAESRLQLEEGGAQTLVVTDSQAFGEVSSVMRRYGLPSHVSCPGEVVRRETGDASERRAARRIRLTSFSILFARQKGDLDEYVRGLAALRALKDGDTVLIAEGCTHHRQCNDIGTVKIPKALQKLSGKKLNFIFASGGDFVPRARDEGRETGEGQSNNQTGKQSNLSLIVHCGGCMLTRREVLRRIALAREAGIPIVNYGMLLAAANGIEIKRGS